MRSGCRRATTPAPAHRCSRSRSDAGRCGRRGGSRRAPCADVPRGCRSHGCRRDIDRQAPSRAGVAPSSARNPTSYWIDCVRGCPDASASRPVVGCSRPHSRWADDVLPYPRLSRARRGVAGLRGWSRVAPAADACRRPSRGLGVARRATQRALRVTRGNSRASGDRSRDQAAESVAPRRPWCDTRHRASQARAIERPARHWLEVRPREPDAHPRARSASARSGAVIAYAARSMRTPTPGRTSAARAAMPFRPCSSGRRPMSPQARGPVRTLRWRPAR